MENFYVTFGQKYRQEKNPMCSLAHPDGWVRIIAPDFGVATKKTREIFDQYYSMVYSSSEFEPGWYHRGEIAWFCTEPVKKSSNDH